MAVSIEKSGLAPKNATSMASLNRLAERRYSGNFGRLASCATMNVLPTQKAAEEAAENRRVVQMMTLHACRFATVKVGFETSPRLRSRSQQRCVARTFWSLTKPAKTGSFLIFRAPPGTGKTHLALAVLSQPAARWMFARYFCAIDMIRQLRSGWRRDSGRSELEELDSFVAA